MHRKRLLCWKAYLPRSSWPTQPTTPIICARPSLPKARSPSSPTTRHGRSNIRSTSISMPSAISWSAASQNSNNSAASQPVSKRQPEITLPSSLSQPSSYGCDKCPHHLAGAVDGIHDPSPERGNSPVTRLLGAGHQINRFGGAGADIKRSDQLLAESWPRLDQGCHCQRDAKALLGGLQHRRDAIEPKLTARGHFRNSGLLEPERPGAR